MKKKQNEITIRSSAAEYLTYVAAIGDKQDSIEMRYEDENIWLTQKMMATLYDVGLPTINEHIKKIFEDCELNEVSTIRKFRIVQNEGNRQVTHLCFVFLGNQPFATRSRCLNSSSIDQKHENATTPSIVDKNIPLISNEPTMQPSPANRNSHQQPAPKWYSALMTMG